MEGRRGRKRFRCEWGPPEADKCEAEGRIVSMMRTERQRLTGWMMWVVMVALSVMTLWLGGRCAVAQRRGPAAKKEVAETSGVVLLDTYGFWRMHFTLAPPMLATGESVKVKHEWMNYKTPGPGEGWQDVGFDDSSWLKGPLTISLKTPLLARACARGKVMVSNPGAVKGLKLSVSYKGGLIVTVNGKEVKREGIAAGAKLAEGPVGQERSVEDLAIPSGLLKKGVNVVGLEVVRAAHEQQADYYFEHGCEIVSARLSVSSGNGVQANVVRPKGFQVWNADAMATDFTLDFGDACEELRPVKIVGTRNGRFTGKVMVGSDKAIRGLKVRPGALSGQGGSIPAEKVHVRYGRQWGMQRVAAPRTEPYATWANRLGELVDEAPETVEVMVPEKWSWYGFPHKPAFTPVSGAVVPVWLTVEVPADTKAGSYSGSVTISAKGEKGVRVPVSLSVSDYLLPDTQDYRTWVDVIQCPDTLALEYGVEMWSEKHWEMIAKSFRLIGQTGSRTVYVPLIAHTNLGNEESMVRWVKRADGTYGYDFSILERYLDVAEKEMGTPKVVILVVWETYMMPTIDASGDKKTTPRGRQRQMAQFLTGRQGATIGHGPLVTVVDGKSGKKENVYLPTLFETEASKALWEPLMKGVRERLDKRGLGKAMMMGLLSDAWPKEEELAFFEGLTGGAPWVIQSHEGLSKRRKIYNKYEVGYQTAVWSVTYSDDNGHRPPVGYYG